MRCRERVEAEPMTGMTRVHLITYRLPGPLHEKYDEWSKEACGRWDPSVRLGKVASMGAGPKAKGFIG